MKLNEKFVITLNRELGSGGRSVGRKLAERLNVKYYDKAVIEGLTKKFGVSAESIERIKAEKISWWNNIEQFFSDMVLYPLMLLLHFCLIVIAIIVIGKICIVFLVEQTIGRRQGHAHHEFRTATRVDRIIRSVPA